MKHPIEIISITLFTLFFVYFIIDVISFFSWYKWLESYEWDYKYLKKYHPIYLGITTVSFCKYKLYKKNKMQKQLYTDNFKLIKSIEACKKEYKL